MNEPVAINVVRCNALLAFRVDHKLGIRPAVIGQTGMHRSLAVKEFATIAGPGSKWLTSTYRLEQPS